MLVVEDGLVKHVVNDKSKYVWARLYIGLPTAALIASREFKQWTISIPWIVEPP